MRFYERFWDFRALRIRVKCTSRHLFRYGGLNKRRLGTSQYQCDENVGEMKHFLLLESL